MNRILVVEDEPTIAIALQDDLEEEGYRVEAVSDGITALEKTRAGFDLVLLDVMLPGKDGFTVLREMRKQHDRTPVILLTARGQEQDRITGLSLGADDYVIKPFSRQELLLRVQAVLRRSGPARAGLYRFGQIELDCERGEMRRSGSLVDVTALEFRLLRMFCENRGKVLSLDQIISHVWGEGTFQSDRVVYTHINNLRGKIEPTPSQPRYIVSVRGLGYRFDA
jgi:DNA-binding response OmpR family regulator